MKRLMALVSTFLFEEVPDVDALPFWFADGIYNMMLYKAEQVVEQVPGANIVNKAIRRKETSGQQYSSLGSTDRKHLPTSTYIKNVTDTRPVRSVREVTTGRPSTTSGYIPFI